MLLLALACSDPEPAAEWWDCTEEPCLRRLLPPAWEADPGATLSRLQALDPIAQEAALRVLAVHDPNALHQVCDSLADEAARTCARLRDRPHLAMDRPPATVAIATRSAPGPSGANLPLPERRDPPTEAGQQALQACIAAAGGRTRSECIFRQAEQLARQVGPAAYGDALALCLASDDFERPCTQHLSTLALPPASPADAPSQDALDALAQALAEVETAVGPELAPLYRDRALALWVDAAFRGAGQPTGHLLTLLPEAAPHVRMSAAWTHLLRAGVGQHDLDALTIQIASRLAVQGPATATSPRRQPAELFKSPDLWPADQTEAEAALPAVSCLGFARRPVADDPEIDLQIAVLEAAARLREPPPRAFFAKVAADPDRSPVVRWTAARVGGRVHGGSGWPDIQP